MSASTNSSYSSFQIYNDTGTSTGGLTFDTSNTVTISSNQVQPTRSNQCNAVTQSGGRCQLEPHFDDGRCHHHTSEQCFATLPDGGSCSLPGSQPDGRCHHHTTGCNESLTHKATEKAVFHGVKSAFRWLGMHRDTRDGEFDLQPVEAARIAAFNGIAYLQAHGLTYDRDKSIEYLADKGYIDDTDVDPTWRGQLKQKYEDVVSFLTDDKRVESLKDGIKQSWNQINEKEHHKDGARTAVAIAEWYLGEEFEVDA